MSLPVTVPFTFGNATTTQSLSSLDTNFTTITNSVNGLTNGASKINVASITATGTANATTYLRGDGAWATVSGGGGNGTVTSIDANSSIGFTFTGGPVTSAGTLTLSGPAPGTLGNVLTSNGTAWVSSAVASGTVNSVNGFTGTVQSVVVQGTAVSSTSGTSISFTNIPSWVKRIIITFAGVATTTGGGAANANPIVQLGTGATPTYTTSGYVGAADNRAGTNIITSGFGAAYLGGYTISGQMILCLNNANTWTESVTTFQSAFVTCWGAGYVALGSALTAIRVTTVGGTDTFTSGTINIQYE